MAEENASFNFKLKKFDETRNNLLEEIKHTWSAKNIKKCVGL